jgi:hypothetical protein
MVKRRLDAGYSLTSAVAAARLVQRRDAPDPGDAASGEGGRLGEVHARPAQHHDPAVVR